MKNQTRKAMIFIFSFLPNMKSSMLLFCHLSNLLDNLYSCIALSLKKLRFLWILNLILIRIPSCAKEIKKQALAHYTNLHYIDIPKKFGTTNYWARTIILQLKISLSHLKLKRVDTNCFFLPILFFENIGNSWDMVKCFEIMLYNIQFSLIKRF